AKGNAGPVLIKICEALGYHIEFYEKKKINGKPYTSVFVVRLAENVYSYCLVRSYDAVKRLEGVELAWMWSEEGQDAERENFVIAFSRIRGDTGEKALFYAAMPEDEEHWQYD